ncbi:matrixin family metalloprotease [Streptomyces sp. NPDC021622]|uniref:matrixin family metalloprotease n=1 Tax=Streptomyces sp. NPDC021622 TaxID=3155013 RepID=UPI0033E57DEA
MNTTPGGYMRSRARHLAVTTVALAGLFGGLSTGSSQAAQNPSDTEASPLAAYCDSESDRAVPADVIGRTVSLADCDLRGRLIKVGDLGVRVPTQENKGVTYSVQLADDAAPDQPLSINVRRHDGKVTTTVRRADDPAAGAKSAPAKCDDGEYAFSKDGDSWDDDPMEWRFNQGSVPGYLDAETIRNEVTESADNVDFGRNNCGLAEDLDSDDATYEGTTDSGTNIGLESCDDDDGDSVVAFGDRRAGVLATTCAYESWWFGWYIDEADIEINDNQSEAPFLRAGNACLSEFYLESTMTHEFGHAFGLGHVPSGHENLTMAPTADVCSNDKSYLGKGDYNGLHELEVTD